jgi:hypothetical protein
VLRPLGLAQKGRSRLWYDDNGWWLCNVEFQPSSFTRGSYLNVGAQFLWDIRDYPVFSFGHRVDEAPFVEYESDGQFAPAARAMAEVAAERVAFYRTLFGTVQSAADALNDLDRWTGLEHTSHNPDVMDRAIASGLAGDVATARRLFEARIDEYERDLAAGEIYSEHEAEERDRAAQLLDALADDTFAERIERDIAETRRLLKLDVSRL